MKRLKKKNELYLSDKQPLSTTGKVMLLLSYVVLAAWTIAILWPLLQMVISAFNGRQQQYLMINDNFSFSMRHFKYLFENTLYLTWVKNTIFIASVTADRKSVVVGKSVDHGWGRML